MHNKKDQHIYIYICIYFFLARTQQFLILVKLAHGTAACFNIVKHLDSLCFQLSVPVTWQAALPQIDNKSVLVKLAF